MNLAQLERPAVALPSFGSVARIQATVAASFGLPTDSMWSKARGHTVAHPRQIAIYLARRLTLKSPNRIGQLFARDRTTVLFAIEQVEKRMASDPIYRADVEALREALS